MPRNPSTIPRNTGARVISWRARGADCAVSARVAASATPPPMGQADGDSMKSCAARIGGGGATAERGREPAATATRVCAKERRRTFQSRGLFATETARCRHGVPSGEREFKAVRGCHEVPVLACLASGYMRGAPAASAGRAPMWNAFTHHRDSSVLGGTYGAQRITKKRLGRASSSGVSGLRA